jgi:predicted ester cyclase
MSDANRALVNLMIEQIQNRKNIGLVDELFSEDFLNHTLLPGIASDRNGMRALFSMFHTAFPDGVVTVEDQISSDDKVWTRKFFSGTHTGPFRSIAPTGNRVTYTVVDILGIRCGKMVDHWSLIDRLPFLQQLGLYAAGLGG